MSEIKPAPARPLDGLRVVDTSSFISGPFCTTQLAEFGAEVIKCELPGTGDPLRHFGSRHACGETLMWLSECRNKKSVTLNLKAPEGKTIFLRLVETKEPPPLDHTKATRELIAKLYGRETGAVIALPGIAMEWDSELLALKEQRKQIDEQIGLLENQIINAIGSASAGVLPNGTIWSYKTQTRKEHVVKASEFRVLRRHGAREDR